MDNFERIEKEEFDIENIYTSLEDAKEEIWKRWNDKELRKKVEEYLGNSIPEIMINSPRAILARNIASPNNEFIEFLDLSKKIDLKPVCLEYIEDKFRAENEDKYFLGKICFCDSVEEKNVDSIKILDFDSSEGKKISDIKTRHGNLFVDFHHNLLKSILSEYNMLFFDESMWIKKNGGSPKYFYKKFFSLFLCYGILFENYLTNRREGKFIKDLVIPAFLEIYKEFNLKPLVDRIYPSDNEDDLFWRQYPKVLKEKVKI